MAVNRHSTKDPLTVRSRLFVGALPEVVDRNALEEYFKKFGPISSINLNRGFGFVQYQHEDSCRLALQEQNPNLFGKKIYVKPAVQNPIPTAATLARSGNAPPNAGPNKGPSNASNNNGNDGPVKVQIWNTPTGTVDPQQRQPLLSGNSGGGANNSGYDDANDCEIIVTTRELTSYAEMIEMRLKERNLTVDLLFPNSDVPIAKVLGNISSRGCLYAILVTPQNQEHRSITVNILYGQPTEHRNMPLDDAIVFIHKNYQGRHSTAISQSNAPPLLPEQHPEAVDVLLKLLAENRMLMVSQYNTIIRYLEEKRDAQQRAEVVVGDKTAAEELQEKILSILSKPQIEENISILQTVPEPEPVVEKDILSDERVQRALDALLNSCISIKM